MDRSRIDVAGDNFTGVGVLEGLVEINFQAGTIKECGVNGCYIEDLLEIAEFRLQGHQDSSLPCPENEVALKGIRSALACLANRTRLRTEQGVESTLHPHKSPGITRTAPSTPKKPKAAARKATKPRAAKKAAPKKTTRKTRKKK